MLKIWQITFLGSILNKNYIFTVTNGRIYGGFWQKLNGEYRDHIVINGQQTIEIDYSGVGIYLLYDKYKIPRFKGDAYDLSSVGYHYSKYTYKELRPLLKYALMIMINSSNEVEALFAIKDKIREHQELPQDIDIKPLIEAFAKRHEAISRFFYKGMGIIQYRLDSEICANIISYFLYHYQYPNPSYRVIEELRKEGKLLKGMPEEVLQYIKGGVPVLTVHDSFIILAEHEKALRKQMEGQYKHLLNIDWETDIKTKTEYQENIKELGFVSSDFDKPLTDFTDTRQIMPFERWKLIEQDFDFEERYRLWKENHDYKNYYSLKEEPIDYAYKDTWKNLYPFLVR